MTVFITAGFSNLGSAIAKAFADRGDEVFVSSRTEKAHPYGKCIAMDLSDPASVGDAVSAERCNGFLLYNLSGEHSPEPGPEGEKAALVRPGSGPVFVLRPVCGCF